ncbi:MAG: TraR/DksA family transcriptional regulator [Acidobacteria bacterium]|nr:TraR/DksA family transcriptional regulator [Acidobacteriota bacterium]
MRKRERERFHKLLDQKRQALLARSARTADEGREVVPEGGEDYVDDAVTHYTREFLLSLSDLERRQLMLVEEALVRLREHTFGECLMCGEEVGQKRLEAIPWARYCVQCQELAEREELAQSVHVRDIATEEEEE